MGLAIIVTKVGRIIAADGRLECFMALGDIRGQMAAGFPGTTLKTRKMALGFSHGEMAGSTRVIGAMGSSMVTVFCWRLMAH